MHEYLEHAKHIAVLAGRLLNSYFGTLKKYDKKNGAGIVTKADKESEALIINYFKKHTAKFSILAEESGFEQGNKQKFTWVIDPLDGTTNFFHGFPYYNVSIALVNGEDILVAVIYDPVRDKLFSAIKGEGAFLDGKRIRVSQEDNLENALFGTGFAYMRGKELDTAIKVFHRFSEKSRGIRRPGAAALDLAYTALGVYDGFFEKALNPWDLAAGALLVKEAGGILSNFEGDVFSIYGRSIVAGNNKLHTQMLSLIKQVQEEG